MEKLKQLWEKTKTFIIVNLIPFIRKNTEVEVTKGVGGKHKVIVSIFNEEIFNKTV